MKYDLKLGKLLKINDLKKLTPFEMTFSREEGARALFPLQ